MRSYIYRRDGGRCGLCTAEMKIKGAQIEHVVPKVFVLFDAARTARPSRAPSTSRLHKIDNLQAAHTSATSARATPSRSTSGATRPCRLTVADTDDGEAFVLPRKPSARSAR